MNQFNETSKIVDLNCLSIGDSIVILKTKIFELAFEVSEESKKAFDPYLKYRTDSNKS